MLLWIILTIMTSAAAVWISAPLLRQLDSRQSAAARDLEVYRDQLTEIEKEKAEGLIDGEQATAASLEVKRRMLLADQAQGEKSHQISLGERHLAVVSVAGIVVLGSVILYSNSGRPDLPSVARAPTSLVLGDANQASRFQTAGGATSPQSVATQASAQTPAQGGASPGLGSVDDMIQRLVDRLAKDPANGETWRMLGWSYFSTERYAEAADAYKKAMQLQPGNAGLMTSYGEALVRAANGEVKPEALTNFDAVLALDAKEPRARFFKGLALEQAGNKRGALDAWIAVLADAGPDADWAPDLKNRVMELAGELGVNVDKQLPVAANETANPSAAVAPATGGILQKLQNSGGPIAGAATPARGPSADDVKAAEALAPAQRTDMIRGMVEGLAARLEKSPRDANGWIQLIRSRKVMGEPDAAKAAFSKAMGVFQDSPADQKSIAAAAAEIGLTR